MAGTRRTYETFEMLFGYTLMALTLNAVLAQTSDPDPDPAPDCGYVPLGTVSVRGYPETSFLQFLVQNLTDPTLLAQLNASFFKAVLSIPDATVGLTVPAGMSAVFSQFLGPCVKNTNYCALIVETLFAAPDPRTNDDYSKGFRTDDDFSGADSISAMVFRLMSAAFRGDAPAGALTPGQCVKPPSDPSVVEVGAIIACVLFGLGVLVGITAVGCRLYRNHQANKALARLARAGFTSSALGDPLLPTEETTL